ncbi:MAG: BON domain-containing protein [Labilithrix sp.]|nr:BON domain-containing protein [Labilithrix sp.]
MDHRWDEATWQDRAARRERERFGARRIERDPDVERRDRQRLAERMREVNQSPWAIGLAWYDQRDMYTRNAEIDERGYGCGPSVHPEEGSFAYHREPHPGVITVDASHASLPEKEAWPWLVYKDPESDPYFAHLHAHEHPRPSVWQRLKAGVASALHVGPRAEGERTDTRILDDVYDALRERRDLDASDVAVRVERREVTLEGTVTDARSKRAAEEVTAAVAGVRAVHNHLTIRHDDPSDADVAFVLPLALMMP